MPTIEEALYAKLSTTSAITALVSTRIYPAVVPENGKIPAIVYQKIAQDNYSALQTDPNINKPTFQISIFGTTYKQVKDISAQVKLALRNYTDTTIKAVIIQSENDGYNKDQNEYFEYIDFDIFY